VYVNFWKLRDKTHTHTQINTHTGYHTDEQEAAKAVDEFMKKHFIDPPNLNFLQDGT
jgi:hypothetical protein